MFVYVRGTVSLKDVDFILWRLIDLICLLQRALDGHLWFWKKKNKKFCGNVWRQHKPLEECLKSPILMMLTICYSVSWRMDVFRKKDIFRSDSSWVDRCFFRVKVMAHVIPFPYGKVQLSWFGVWLLSRFPNLDELWRKILTVERFYMQ